MSEVLIEARRRVVIPYRTPNGTLARHTFFPPTEKLVNRIDSGLLADMKKNRVTQAYFEHGVLTELRTDKANDYVEGTVEPPKPEVPPLQDAAEEHAKEAFPAPVEGKTGKQAKASK